MGGIFISYRRDDSRHAAGRLLDRLAQTFGREQLFMDVDNLEAGVDFVAELDRQVAKCDVMLVLIGPRWLDARSEKGRRLDDASDFVRIEIERALQREIRIVPLLIDGAQPPDPTQLPASLQGLSRRQAIVLTHERFGSDVEGLNEALAKIVRPRKGKLSDPGVRSSELGVDLGRMVVGGMVGSKLLLGQTAEAVRSGAARVNIWLNNAAYGLAWIYGLSFSIIGIGNLMEGNRSDQQTAPFFIAFGLALLAAGWLWRRQRIAKGGGWWGFL